MWEKFLDMLPSAGDVLSHVTALISGAVLTGVVSVAYFAGEAWTRNTVQDEIRQTVSPRLDQIEGRQQDFTVDIEVIKATTSRTEVAVDRISDHLLSGTSE